MTDVLFEDEMATAVEALRRQLDQEQIPAFVPSRTRSPLLAAAAIVVILGLGVMWGFLASGDDSSSDITIATQPETGQDRSDDDAAGGEEADANPTPPDSTSSTEDAEAEVDAPDESQNPEDQPESSSTVQESQLVGQLTNASAGQFIVPLPSASAWNADETALLLYRTGDGPIGHIVVSAATGEMLASVDLDPPDIEQIYWHPTEPTVLIAVEDDEVWSFDFTTSERAMLQRIASCPQGGATAGLPSPPAASGMIAVLCDTADGTQIVEVNVITGAEASRAADDGVDSVHVSPSGATVVSVLEDGSAIARTAGSDVVLDLGGDLFDYVTIDGVETIASMRYSGDAVGTVVLFDLSDGSTQVVIGPDAGDEFPPVGPAMHASGARLVISTAGPAEGELAGRVLLVDLDRVGDEIVAAIPHDSIRDSNGYWSDAFVTLSPSGRYAAYSSDRGGDSVDTTVVEFPP